MSKVIHRVKVPLENVTGSETGQNDLGIKSPQGSQSNHICLSRDLDCSEFILVICFCSLAQIFITHWNPATWYTDSTCKLILGFEYSLYSVSILHLLTLSFERYGWFKLTHIHRISWFGICLSNDVSLSNYVVFSSSVNVSSAVTEAVLIYFNIKRVYSSGGGGGGSGRNKISIKLNAFVAKVFDNEERFD